MCRFECLGIVNAGSHLNGTFLHPPVQQERALTSKQQVILIPAKQTSAQVDVWQSRKLLDYKTTCTNTDDKDECYPVRTCKKIKAGGRGEMSMKHSLYMPTQSCAEV